MGPTRPSSLTADDCAARIFSIAATRPFDVAQYSRLSGECYELPEMHERHDALVELLERHAERWRGQAVFPSHDDSLTILARSE